MVAKQRLYLREKALYHRAKIKVGDASPGNKCDQPGSSGFNLKQKQDNASSKHGRAEEMYRSIVTALLGKTPQKEVYFGIHNIITHQYPLFVSFLCFL